MDLITPIKAITRWIITPIWPPKLSEIIQRRKSMLHGFGRCQGIQAVGGNNCGPGLIDHICGNVNWTRSWEIMWQGGSWVLSHRESLSAWSLRSPAMWDVSTSMPVDEMRMLSFSVKSASGIVVVNRELDTLSAAELSDNVGILIGIRNPGWNRVVMNMRAICARVSRLEISFCKLSCIGIFRAEKSALHNGRLNHLSSPHDACLSQHDLCPGDQSLGRNVSSAIPSFGQDRSSISKLVLFRFQTQNAPNYWIYVVNSWTIPNVPEKPWNNSWVLLCGSPSYSKPCVPGYIVSIMIYIAFLLPIIA